ncbi:MAG: M28 family peptidase [Actinobacteria bacterium]|nr:MAG: M28 family peptidase [Actinomycetota bacterium]
MRQLKSRVIAFAWLVPLCVAAWLVMPASAGATVSSAGCDNRSNDTPSKLVECVRTGDLWQHMQAFQAIADANPGPDGHPSRNAGEPGYKASADYVANLMKQAGYDVSIQTYQFDYFVFTDLPTMSEVSPIAHDYGLTTEFNPGLSIGTTTAEIQPAGGIKIPSTGGSTSGCDPSDFTGFVAGRIALIQRGTCTFSQKVANAQNAGASGVIIFNEGNTAGRSVVFSGSLTGVPTIPVAFTSFAVGNDLYNQYQSAVANSTALPTISLNFQGIHDPNRDDYNVIADSKSGDPNHILVVDAHLDAIYGAGMLDNASGSATILDIAQKMKRVHTLNKMRFIWFGGEELGLLGSHHYVDNLSASELSKIRYDLDADVTSTPNYVIGVLDPAGVDLFGRTVSTQFPPQVYEPSKVSRDQLINYFDSIGKQHETFSPVGTDAFSFNMAGVPASGVLTGQDCCKSQDEVNMFGGYTGNFEGNVPSFDGGCVDNPFRWCDNLDNNDPNVLTFMSKAFADTTARMAFNRSVIWAGDSKARAARRHAARVKLRRGAPRGSTIR